MNGCRWVTNRSNYPLWSTNLLIKFRSLFCQHLTWHIIDLPIRNNGKLLLIVFAKGAQSVRRRPVMCDPVLHSEFDSINKNRVWRGRQVGRDLKSNPIQYLWWMALYFCAY